MATRPNLDMPVGRKRPARFVLRDATRSGHDTVDTAFAGFDLGSRDGYARFLAAHYIAHSEAEYWLALADLPAPFRLAERTPLIAADLADLGVDAPALPLPQPVPSSTSFAAGAGILYTIAGSTFGAQILITRLADGAPSRLLSQGLPGGYWQRLVDALDRIEAAGALGAAIAASRRTFALFAASADRIARGPHRTA